MPRRSLESRRPNPAAHDGRLILAAVLCSVLAWVAGTLAGRSSDPSRIGLIVVGAICTGLAVGLPLIRMRHALTARTDAIAAARAAEDRMRITLEDALHPFVYLLLTMAGSRGSDKNRLRGAAVHQTVATIEQLLLPERTRVTYFAYDEGPPAQLRAEQFSGRGDPPIPTLSDATPEGTAALELLRRKHIEYCRDTRRDPPAVWWDVAHNYRTYLVVPVATTAENTLGLLVLDALRPGELANVDQALVRLLADHLAIAMVI